MSTGQSNRTDDRKTHLALKELETGSTTGANVTEFVLGTIVGDDGGSVTTTDDDNGTILGSFDVGVEEGLGTLSECRELEHTSGTRVCARI